MKYLQPPLADIQEKFRRFNDTLIKNMSAWTEKIARAMVYIINVGRHFLEFLGDIGKALFAIWDSFPQGVKIAITALAGLTAVINASPLGRMIMLVSALLLLIDDYYGYMEGKNAAFGKYWDALNEYIEKAKKLWEEWRPVVTATLETVVEYLLLAKDTAINFAKEVSQALDDIGNSETFQGFVTTTKELGKAFIDLGSGFIDGAIKGATDFIKRLKDSGGVAAFNGMLDRLGGLLAWLYEGFVDVIKTLAKWLDELRKDDDVRKFAEAVTDLLGVVIDLFNAIWDLAGTALKALFEGFDDDKHAYNFRDVLREVVKTLTLAVKWVLGLIKELSSLFKLLANSNIVKSFFRSAGEFVKGFINIVSEAIKMTGKLGRALLTLVDDRQGTFLERLEKAAKIAGGAVNDFRDLAEKGGKAGGNTNEEKIWSWAKSEGLSDVEAAAMLGNLRQEAGADFSTSASEDGSDFKIDGETDYGLVQWTSKNRQQGLKEMADSMGKKVSDLDVQLAYMKKEWLLAVWCW